MTIYAVEAWTFPTEGDEEPCEVEMVDSFESEDIEKAKIWTWNRMEEGFFVRLWER